MKMKNRPHRYDVNRSRSKLVANIVNIKSVSVWWWLYIWSSIHEKVKQHWDWVKKNLAYKKSVQGKYQTWPIKIEAIIKFDNLAYIFNLMTNLSIIEMAVLGLWKFLLGCSFKKSLKNFL